MIRLAKDLLTNILKDHGVPVSGIFYDDSAFERIKTNPSAIILAMKEELNEVRRKVAKWEDPVTHQRYARHQKYERVLPIEVNIFHKNEEMVDEIIQGLLADLPNGIDDGTGNYVPITPAPIDWPPDQKERALAVVMIKFTFGVYKDVPLTGLPGEVNINI